MFFKRISLVILVLSLSFPRILLGSVFGRMDFSRIFCFGPPDFVADFVAGFFLIFVGKSAQKTPPGNSPAKSFKIYTTKIPDTFLPRGRAKFCGFMVTLRFSLIKTQTREKKKQGIAQENLGKSKPLRAQRLKHVKMALRDCSNIQARLKISSGPPTNNPAPVSRISAGGGGVGSQGGNYKGQTKWDKLNGTSGAKFAIFFADLCRFSPCLRIYNILGPQIVAENRRFALFWGGKNSKGRDRKFQSTFDFLTRLKVSSEIEFLQSLGPYQRPGGVKTYRTLEGGGTRPESCPCKAWTFDPQIEDFL